MQTKRKETEMTDIQNDFYTKRTGRFVSVAEVAKLIHEFRRRHRVAKFERESRVVRGKKAFRQPGTAEAGKYNMIQRQQADFLDHMLGVKAR